MPTIMHGKPCSTGFRVMLHSDRVCRTPFEPKRPTFPARCGADRHCRHQQREQGDGHFLADFRGEATNLFSICLLVRTWRGVSLVQASLKASGLMMSATVASFDSRRIVGEGRQGRNPTRRAAVATLFRNPQP